MLAVGIRELKAQLSEYVGQAKRGEVVLITDRGRVVAELRAATVRSTADDALGPILELVDSGVLRRGHSNQAEAYQPSHLQHPSGTSARLLNWLRGDGTEDLGNGQ